MILWIWVEEDEFDLSKDVSVWIMSQKTRKWLIKGTIFSEITFSHGILKLSSEHVGNDIFCIQTWRNILCVWLEQHSELQM